MAGILAISYTSLLFYILLVLSAPDMRWGGGLREKILVRSTLHDTVTLQSWGKTARNFSSITYCQESNYAQIIYHLNSVDSGLTLCSRKLKGQCHKIGERARDDIVLNSFDHS